MMSSSALLTPPAVKLVWNAILNICKHQRLKKAVESNFKGSLVTGSSALLGGLFLGPFGMALGGLVGGVMGASWYQGESVVSILMSLSPEEQQDLVESLYRSVQDCASLENLATLVMNSNEVKNIALGLVKEAIESRGRLLE